MRIPPEATTHERDAGASERECARDGSREREAVEHESGRVVHEALPADDRRDAARDRDSLENCLRSNRVRRRDDRAERKGQRPGKLGDRRVHDDGNHRHREDDQADGVQPDRPCVALELHPVRRPGRTVEQRRHDEQHDDVGVDVRPRQMPGEPERDAPDDERDG